MTIQRFGPGKANVVFGCIFAGLHIGAALAAYGADLIRTLAES